MSMRKRILLSLSLLLTSCSSAPLDTKIYTGDSQTGSVKRINEQVYCTDKKMDEFVCMSASDLGALIQKAQECRDK